MESRLERGSDKLLEERGGKQTRREDRRKKNLETRQEVQEEGQSTKRLFSKQLRVPKASEISLSEEKKDSADTEKKPQKGGNRGEGVVFFFRSIWPTIFDLWGCTDVRFQNSNMTNLLNGMQLIHPTENGQFKWLLLISCGRLRFGIWNIMLNRLFCYLHYSGQTN